MSKIIIRNDVIVCFGIIYFALIIIALFTSKDKNVDKAVIKNNKEVIKQKTKENDSLKIEVSNIEKIKDAKVIEVTTLDNDSTIKLFYKLVKE